MNDMFSWSTGRKHLLWSALTVFMALLVFAFWQEEADRNLFRSTDFKRLKADLVLYGVRYSRDSRRQASQWLVEADTARVYEKKRECRFDRVNILFMPEAREPVRIVGREGLYDFDHGRLQVSGDVVVDGFRDYVLYASSLLYDPETMTITAPERAEMVDGGGSRLRGTSMIYYLKERRLTLASPTAVIPGDKTALN